MQRDLFERVRDTVQSKALGQTPFFVGDLNKPLFFTQVELNHCPEPFAFIQRRCYSAFDSSSLEGLYQKIKKQMAIVFPDFYYSLGLAFLEKENHGQALDMLETAVEHAKHHLEEKLFALGVAQFNNQLYSNASQTLQRCLSMTTQETQIICYIKLFQPLINLLNLNVTHS
ncbi:MAG: hypothetical protein HC881_05370 [Leptolyngbyaceae cyanobacterium SL_7_1]|nr:hypothetical protein [Leptolyngbyaceae cyanobacterium SL_7_1]